MLRTAVVDTARTNLILFGILLRYHLQLNLN